jgi:hypothetical protein
MARTPKTLYEIDGNGCWNWIDNIHKGQPRITRNGNKIDARQFYFHENFGIQPTRKEPIINTCGNPNCVNPEHFRLRTETEKAISRVKKALHDQKRAFMRNTYTPKDIARITKNIREMTVPLMKAGDPKIFTALITCFLLARKFATESQIKWINKQVAQLINDEQKMKNAQSATT